ncbi:acrosin-like [Centropristis striata]|uniref:acrosin-like n=1 Tax=Centropristis striata TaxID=184440 RepID=UPI0027DF6311|nr:acrosin-like [Centropristis striata]
MAFIGLVTVLVLIHNTAGVLGAEVSSSIVGGQDALKNKWPWMVHLNITSDGVKKWRCGGTILNSQWILTAAHCWVTDPPPKLDRCVVWVGAHSLEVGAERYMQVDTIVPDEKYGALSSGYVNDIALVKLKKKIRFSKQVSGDYGGPLVCSSAGGFVQVGIMSYGSPDGCGLPGRPGFYTQVSKHLTFINDWIHR